MLRRLTIRDFVIVDRLELEFSPGFGALTGETGAGKSILLDALGLALGARGESGMVRSGRERAEICAEFDLPAAGPLRDWLAEQSLPVEEGVLLLRRTLEAGGRSRAWINGSPVALTQLREAGDWLADIHGQHAHHALLKADYQRLLLDAHAGLGELAAQVAQAYRAWRSLREARAAAEADLAGLARERELLEWQVQELAALDFSLEGWEELNAEQARLAHAAGLIEGADQAIALLGDSEPSIAAQLEMLAARIAELAGYDEALGDARDLLQGAAIQSDEALHALRRYRDRLEIEPERLAQLDARIAAIADLARKYRITPEEIPALLADCRARLESLNLRADPVALAEREAAAEAAYRELAARLSAARAPVAAALSEAVTAAMQTLAMAGGRFQIVLQPRTEGAAHGLEDVEFQVATNPSQPLRNLARVVSGGELSRIGLAIQVITSRNAATPTLIFDEVDVGIGGRVAEIVGQLLRQLGQERQVLCVTHLPQVAAQADWQWTIAKVQRDGETLSQVLALDDAGRVGEIARMLGGVAITATTREHAAELLARRGNEALML